jgi:ATP adenylyltransferase/5',5'''-P-1,P-4-tetraphosphate phosphorylase II
MVTQTCFMDDRESWIGQYGTLGIRPNDFPICSLHLLLVTTEHHGNMRPDDLRSALDFARTFPEYLVFHNMAGSGATRPDHLHFQAILRDDLLPIQTAPRQKLAEQGGTTLARIATYPVYALSVRGKSAVDTTIDLLRALAPHPYNLLLVGDEIIIIPRRLEQPGGFSSRFAALEMAGCIILVDEVQQRELTYAEACQALSECGFSHADGEVLERRFCRQDHGATAVPLT